MGIKGGLKKGRKCPVHLLEYVYEMRAVLDTHVVKCLTRIYVILIKAIMCE